MIEPLWCLEAVVAATGGKVEGEGANVFSSVSIDSRGLAEGALFVAIKGENLDGHAFVAKAFDAGAAGAIVAASVDAGGREGRLITVNDTFEALNGLGRGGRERCDATVIAVTGSVGKTGTKEALRHALAPAGLTHASQKSYNNQWGVPLSLANMPQETRFGVFEVGMNHAGEIAALVDLIRPHIAIITTIEPVHLEFFASLEAIAEAKAEIFQGLVAGGTAVINRDNDYYELLAGRAEQCGAGLVLDFGVHKQAFARLVNAWLHADGSDVEALVGGAKVVYRIGTPGHHHVLNSLAVLAAVHAAGADVSVAAESLAQYRAQKGRGERFVIGTGEGDVTIIDESYNANPASMRAGLMAMAQTPRSAFPRRIAVLGDMLELGENGPILHRALAQAVDAAGVDVVFACGPLMSGLFDALPQERRGGYAKSAVLLSPMVVDAVAPGDVVMVKGSLGSRMEPIVTALRERLSSSHK